MRNSASTFSDSTDFCHSARLGLSFAEFVYYAPNKLDALQKIVDANILIRPVGIGSGVADAERGNGCGRRRDSANGPYWPTGRIHRINERWNTINFRSGADHCPSN